MHTKITYICDFSRCGLNTRLHTLVSNPCSEATNIGYFIYWELSLAAEVKSEFIWDGRFEGDFKRLWLFEELKFWSMFITNKQNPER